MTTKKKLPQSKRTGRGTPITAIVKSVVVPKKRPSCSWWVDGAKPDVPREVFTIEARARDIEMQFDPVWKKPEKLGQIGQP